MKSKLAILGGEPLIKTPMKRYNSIGVEEIKAANSVLESGILSGFLGSWSPEFYGGKKVREFEEKWAEFFGVKYAISVNSWTSGLVVCLGTLNLEPGDEVLVTPWTMCATATAILHWNCIPVFVDIEPDYFCIDPDKIEEKITSKTKAILAADIFGQSCDIRRLTEICEKHNLSLVTDTAQAPGAFNGSYRTGTLAKIGGFSLNYHKHIHTGEGGVIVTNDPDLAKRAMLLRNHAETSVTGLEIEDISNMIGHNFRLGEIEAAIGIEQLKKLDGFVKQRQSAAKRFDEGLGSLSGLIVPKVRRDNTHAYYVYGLKLDFSKLEVDRSTLVQALEAEGIEGLAEGYACVHLLPLFQRKIAYGKNGFPWSYRANPDDYNYSKGICPVAEELHGKAFIGFEMCLLDLNQADVNLIIEAFQKVWKNLDLLAKT